MRTIEEVLGAGRIRRFIHPEWASDFPWLTQGTTPAVDGFDLRLFGGVESDVILSRWEILSEVTGFGSVVHARQVHGTRVLFHRGGCSGVLIAGRADGHAASEPGILLTVSVADCVPVSIVDPRHRAIAIVHAGWRGVAGDIVGSALRLLGERVGTRSEDVVVHAGPSICGRCYEVGPEVHEKLGLTVPDRPTPVDLGRVLAAQVERKGVRHDAFTRSAHCTRCDPESFYSHRAGGVGRQIGLLGVGPV